MDTLSYKTISANSKTVDKQWVVVDAEGKTLGRFCSEIAKVLRGKNKTNYTPHVDCGDNVVVINAEKVKFTGNKWNDKIYYRHTGFSGGLRERTAKEQLERKPESILMGAVKGMLPKNTLGRKQLTKLKVFAGSEHAHSAQNPVEYKF